MLLFMCVANSKILNSEITFPRHLAPENHILLDVIYLFAHSGRFRMRFHCYFICIVNATI